MADTFQHLLPAVLMMALPLKDGESAGGFN